MTRPSDSIHNFEKIAWFIIRLMWSLELERKRKKLLEAHYNDAIPLDLMKSEQQKEYRS